MASAHRTSGDAGNSTCGSGFAGLRTQPAGGGTGLATTTWTLRISWSRIFQPLRWTWTMWPLGASARASSASTSCTASHQVPPREFAAQGRIKGLPGQPGLVLIVLTAGEVEAFTSTIETDKVVTTSSSPLMTQFSNQLANLNFRQGVSIHTLAYTKTGSGVVLTPFATGEEFCYRASVIADPPMIRCELSHVRSTRVGTQIIAAGHVTGAIEVHLAAGDALIFTDHIMHGSAARRNPGQRRISVYRYGLSWGRPRHPYRASPALLDRLNPVRRGIVEPQPTILVPPPA